MARWNLSRLSRKARPLPAWASETAKKGSKTHDAVCLRGRRISAADRRRIPRRRISSPRSRSGCRCCSSATGKVCLRKRCGFGDRENRERARGRMRYLIRERRYETLKKKAQFIFRINLFSSRFAFCSCISLLFFTRNPPNFYLLELS